MSISSEITRIGGNIASAYTAVSDKGGTLPAAQNSANLQAAIESIPEGEPYGVLQTIDGDNCSIAVTDANTFSTKTKTITENGTYAAAADGADGFSSVEVNVSGGGGETWVFNMGIMDYLYDVNRRYIFRFRIIGDQTTENYTLLFPGDGTMSYQYKQTNGDVDNLVDGVPFLSIEPILYGAQGVILDYPASGNILELLQNIATKQ